MKYICLVHLTSWLAFSKIKISLYSGSEIAYYLSVIIPKI
jgi:hypothetical protein